jgi:hypothetical protein
MLGPVARFNHETRRPAKNRCQFIVVGTLAIHACLLAYSASVHSPTFNEPGHLVAGIAYWKFGRFDVYKVNPPLSRLVAALPVLATGCKTDWSQYCDGAGARPEMALGEAFVHANGERSVWLFTIARWVCIPFSVLGGYVVLRWSRELYGAAAGNLSLSLWCFCPNILAHGSLITPDMSATAMGAAACYSYWHWLRRPTWRQTILCGAVLGVAELAKTTFILLYIVWPVIWLAYRVPERRDANFRNCLRELGLMALCAIISVFVLNLGYGFEGTFTPVGKYRFISHSLGGERVGGQTAAGGGNRFEHSWLAAMPVPLPKDYLEGIDLQKRDFELYGSKSYLNGVWSEHGWWYYYLEALAIKVPLGTWLLLLLGASRRLWWRMPGSREDPETQSKPIASEDTGAAASSDHIPLPLPAAGDVRGEAAQPSGRGMQPAPSSCEGASEPIAQLSIRFRDEFALLGPGLAILVFVSSQTGFNEHMRYVLPIFPFFFIWVGRVAVVFSGRQRMVQALVAIVLAWSISSSLWIYPHSLSYFNEVAGGPLGGPAYLLGSNIDWGQDLLFLHQWIANHPNAKPLMLSYFGGVDPSALGIESTDFDFAAENAHGSNRQSLPTGWYAISVNILRGAEFSGYSCNGKRCRLDSVTRELIQHLEPTDKAGNSILIYHLTIAPAN